MCGIYGIVANNFSGLSRKKIEASIKVLANTSGYRGYDSSGCVFEINSTHTIEVLKGNIAVKKLLETEEFNKLKNSALLEFENGASLRMMGHARLATNGSQRDNDNNQPVVRNDIAVIHNGIIVNEKKLWQKYGEFKKSALDSEIIPVILRHELNGQGSLPKAVNRFYDSINGTAAIACMFSESEQILLSSNFGSLYYTHIKGLFVFASEKYFLELVSKEIELELEIHLIEPGHLVLGSASEIQILQSSGCETEDFMLSSKKIPYSFIVNSVFTEDEVDVVKDVNDYLIESKDSRLRKLVETDFSKITLLKRCTNCVLPSTFPFISFDEKGVCNYCKNYIRKLKHQKPILLKELLDLYKSGDSVKCLVPFSGGRDSSYSVHILAKEFGVTPVTYTYDWGMVTDLARRNIARVCGKLGVENIIVSADIKQKRKYIHDNILAWLKNPALGMIPLFMSGDKSFHYYLEKIKRHTGISLNIWGENFLEKTDFKVGFAGVAPEFSKDKIYSMKTFSKLKMMKYIAGQVIQNPRYINSSVFDNLKAQYSRSFQKKTDYYNFYDYYPWEENAVENTIQEVYDWEKAIDTDSTWRIGDGTSAFYNYIYLTVAGFSEFDTFRSNQIREGMILRDKALELAQKENEVRYATLRWYLEILNLDFEMVVNRINSIPKLYEE